MLIVKRDGTEYELDTSKIVEALSKAIHTLVERMQEICEEYFSHAHEIAHALISAFSAVFKTGHKKTALRCVIYAVPLLIPNLKHITLAFLEYSCEVRKLYLLTRYHRGNTDDTDADFCVTY